MRPMIGPFAPTAATATVRASPVKLPTMATSEAWKSCSKIAVAATGRAKERQLIPDGAVQHVDLMLSDCSSHDLSHFFLFSA